MQDFLFFLLMQSAASVLLPAGRLAAETPGALCKARHLFPSYLLTKTLQVRTRF